MMLLVLFKAILFLGGLAAVVYGCWLIHPASAYVFGGLLLVLFAFVTDTSGQRDKRYRG